jgi:hypothetical protein
MEVIRTILGTNQLRFAGGGVSRRFSLATTIPPALSTLSTGTHDRRHSSVIGTLEDRGMNIQVNDDAIDEIVATCNGDIRGALKALMLVNEHLESELQQLYAAVAQSAAGERGSGALH